MDLDVTIIDVTGSRSWQATLPDNEPAIRIIEQLIPQMGLPSAGPDGLPQPYNFHHMRSGKQLADSETLEAVGCLEGDALRVVPTISAGSGSADSLPPIVFRALPGLSISPLVADKYACPHCNFVWYEPEVGADMPDCPTHHCGLSPA